MEPLEPVESVDAVEPVQQTFDVGGHDVAALMSAMTFEPLSRSRNVAKALDVRAEERLTAQHHLEAIVIGGIMAAGYLNAAINVCF